MMSTYTVSLHEASEDDLRLFAEWWNDRRIATGVRKDVEPLPVEENVERFRIWCHEESDSGFGYAIRNAEGLTVGCVSAWGIADPERDASLSLMVGPYYQDHGYGSQALTMALHKLADMQVRTITVRVAAFNLRARHMFEERGFREVGRNKQAIERNTKRFDIVTLQAGAEDAVQALWQDNPYDDSVQLIPRRNIFRVE
ncbi:GNAT family N-acetyltransferase [Bifidobacterium leontopitheci]|nr:GNAT family N-acetyltransferase [Bifidobacterium leontopitheci]